MPFSTMCPERDGMNAHSASHPNVNSVHHLCANKLSSTAAMARAISITSIAEKEAILKG